LEPNGDAMADERAIRKLRKALDKALAKDDAERAEEALVGLAELDPRTPRWPQKRGDLLRKQGKRAEAIKCYGAAADLYADQGFLARAVAMARTVLDLDPRRIDVLERVDPQAARELHRKLRPRGVSAPIAAHAAILPDSEPPAAGHPAIVQDSDAPVMAHPAIVPDETVPTMAHPAILRDSDAPTTGVHPMVIRSDPPAQRAGAQPVPIDKLSSPAPRAPAAYGPATGEHEIPNLGTMEIELPGPPRVPNVYDAVLESVDELVIDPDAAPNETRFSNAPPRRTLEIDVSDLELSQRPPLPADPSEHPDPPNADGVSQLPLLPLFAEVPKAALQELVTGSSLEEHNEGEYVVRAGDAADSLFGIIEGSVEVIVPGQQLRLVLTEGDVFGESCLLAGEKRHADVMARGRVVTLRIPRDVLHIIIQAHPQIAEVLLELLTRRLLGNLLQASPLFQEFDAAGRRELVRLFEVRRAPRGMLMAEAGKLMDGLYINLTGSLEVTGPSGAPERHGAGSMFGQHSLVGQEPSPVNVRAMANMVVLRLPAEGFTKVAMQYPSILAHIAEHTASGVAKVST
jgi:CRP-like cAMP-binding protein